MTQTKADTNPEKNQRSQIPFALCLVALAWSTVLLFAGGFTTSIGAGMAFLDWPLSNGSLNPEGWTQDRDQLAEHSHRLAGKVIGVLSILLAISFYYSEPRAKVRLMSYALLLLVIFQGLLGGLRVLLDTQNIGTDSNVIAQSFAVAHAMGAQVVVLLLTTMAIVTSPAWTGKTVGRLYQENKSLARALGVGTILVLSISILFGAITRHTGAGLAIPTFPAAAADGSWWPDVYTFPVWMHFLHRTLGVVGAIGIWLYAYTYWKNTKLPTPGRWLALLPVLLVLFQIWLGILILQTYRNPHVTTLHMLNGAFILASLWASILWTYTRPKSTIKSVPQKREQETTQPIHAN